MNSKRIQSLDIIKGIAMLMVILVHYNQTFASEVRMFRFFQMGCQLFFVASGFVAAKSFLGKLSKSTFKEASKEFYKARLASIAPAWWIMIVIVYLSNSISLCFLGRALNFGYNRSFFGILCNVLFLNGLNPLCHNNVILGGWYIGTTMILYLLTPLLISLFEKFNKKCVWLLVSIAAMLSIVSLYVVVRTFFPDLVYEAITKNNSFVYFSFVSQLPSFSLGILLYYEKPLECKSADKYKYFALGVLTLILSINLFFHPRFPLSYIVTGVLVGIATYFILKAMIIYEQNKDIGKFFSPIIKVGKQSLYIYLVHGFFAYTFVYVCKYLLSSLNLTNDSHLIFFILIPIVLVLSYVFGTLLNKFTNNIVLPAIKHKRNPK